MPKKITKLTKEQEAMLPVWADKWIKIGLQTGKTDWDTFDKYMPIIYQKAGLKYPKNVVLVPSPFFGAHVASLAHEIWNQRYRDSVRVSVRVSVRDRVGDSVGASVGDSVRDSVEVSVGDSVGASVGDSVRDSVEVSVGDSVEASVRDSVEDSVEASVGASARDSVGASARDSVEVSVEASVRDRVGASVEASVRDSVGDRVRDSVEVSVGDSVEASVRDSVRDSVEDSVGTSVGDSVEDSVEDSVGTSVGDSAYEKEIVETIKILAKKYAVTPSWNYWLGGQFWVGGWYWGSPSFVSFFTDVCGLKLNKDITERAEAYRKVCESVNYIWCNRDFVMVCARPTRIARNNQGRLHNEHGKAIQYPDGWGLYMLNGVKFDEELYKKVVSRNMPMSEILQIKDIDQRVQAMKFAKEGIREFYLTQKGRKIDACSKFDIKGRLVQYELWEIPQGEIFNKTVHFALYECPSAIERGEKREYTKGVPAVKTVAEAMAWGMSDDNNIITPEEWQKLIPLQNES